MVDSQAWVDLAGLDPPAPLRTLFATDPGRAERYTFTCADLTVDCSKHWLTGEVLQALLAVAATSAAPPQT